MSKSDVELGKLREEGSIPKERLLSEVSTNAPIAALSERCVTYHYDFSKYYRWIMLIIQIVMALFVGPLFLNWPPIRNLFDANGAYNSVCTPGSKDYRVGDNGILYCNEKTVEINKIFAFAGSMTFVFTFIAGILLDTLGGKVCTSFGISFLIIGWVIISFCGISFNGFKAGMFFIAAGADPAFFGLLATANLFPGLNATIIGALSASRSISFATSIVMQAIFDNTSLSLRAIALGFAVIQIIWLTYALLFIPMQCYPRVPYLDTEPGFYKTSLKQFVKTLPRVSVTTFKVSAKSQLRGWFKEAFTWGYLALLPLPMVALLRNNYFTMTDQKHLNHVQTFYTMMNPLCFIPCPFLGYLADRVSAAVAMGITQLCGAGALFFGMIDSTVTQTLSVLCNWVFLSFIASQFYCYVAAVYPQQQMGKLTGFVLLVGALVAMASESLYEVASSGGNLLFLVDLIVVILAFAGAVIAFLLFCFVERPVQQQAKIVSLKSVPPPQCEFSDVTPAATNSVPTATDATSVKSA